MADIFDYLNWRGDIPFSADPFNEVDNLILSELSYTDFAGIVSSGGDAIPLHSVFESFFHLHTREEILKSTSLTAKAPLLMEGMMTGSRFENMRLCGYVNVLSTEKDSQFSAMTFLLDDGTAYIAFRGTDSSIIGWKEDFDLGHLAETDGQQRAVGYLEDIAAKLALPLRVGGHSKGGNFAVFAASFCSSGVQDRILSVYSNDGPGFRDEIIDAPGYLRILPKVISIVPDTSVIGLLLSSKSDHQVIRSSASGIFQHDAFTWLVNRNRFEKAAFSDLGKLLDQSLDSWLSGMDDETRKFLSETVFSLFESTGADTFSEIRKHKWKSTEAILNSLRKMPKDKQTELLRIAGKLLQSGSQAAIAQLPEMLLSRNDEGEQHTT